MIGAGHAGLAASRFLTDRSIDHVVLERGEVANSWRRERWDSLRLLTPNWQSRLPGHAYAGPEPDGYMSAPEVVAFIEAFAAASRAPVRTGTEVLSVAPHDRGYRIRTNAGKRNEATFEVTDCNRYTTTQGTGTVAGLPSTIHDPGPAIGTSPWGAGTASCALATQVWCVED